MSLHYPDHLPIALLPVSPHVHTELKEVNILTCHRLQVLPLYLTGVRLGPAQLKKGPMSPSFILELTFVTGMSWNLRQKVCLLNDQ